MAKEFFLSIDVGTQSVRAMVFDAEGNMLQRAKMPITPYYSRHPGWAEQDPDLYWRKICEATNQIWDDGKYGPEMIAGVALTTQRGSIVVVDDQGKPLRPAMLWMDQRRTSGMKPIGGLWGLAFSLIGLRETVAMFQSEMEANWIKYHEPEIWAQVHKYLLLSGYLTYRMIGRFVDSVASQVGYLPFDFKTKKWANNSDWKWLAVEATREMMPDLVQPGEIIDQLSDEASREMGLPPGLPLIAAAGDKGCEVLGSGGIEPHIGCISYGTTANINATHRKYTEVIPLVPPYPAANKDAYNLEIQVYRGFWLISWFKEEFGRVEAKDAIEQGIPAEAVLDKQIKDIPPGSMGLTLQPFWNPGVRIPGPEAKGAVIGWGDVHKRGHLYRAILEGLAYSMREGAERIERRSGKKLTELRVAGGGSQSNVAMQITADVFGLPASRPHTYEASGLGAAIDAAVGLGVHPDFETAVKQMTRIKETFDPIPENHRVYDQLYKDVYLKMYKKLKPLYENIRDITGYPARYDVTGE